MSTLTATLPLADFVFWICDSGPDPDKLYRDHEHKAIRLACKICAHFSRSGAAPHLKDMQNECRMALWEASRKYDRGRNDNFWLYAYLRIRGAAYDYLRKQRIIVKSGKSDYTALCFLSGDMEIQSKGPEAQEPLGVRSFFDEIEGNYAQEALSESINLRIDLERLVDRSGLTAAEKQIIYSHSRGESLNDIAARLNTYQPRISEMLEQALVKIREVARRERIDEYAPALH